MIWAPERAHILFLFLCLMFDWLSDVATVLQRIYWSMVEGVAQKSEDDGNTESEARCFDLELRAKMCKSVPGILPDQLYNACLFDARNRA